MVERGGWVLVEVNGEIEELRAAIALTLQCCARDGKAERLRPLLMRGIAELDQIRVERSTQPV
jgi:hypothetical protein